MARTLSGTNNINFGDNAPLGAASDWTAFAWIYKTDDGDTTIINKRKGFAISSNLFTFGSGNGASLDPNIGKNANYCNFNSVSLTKNVWQAFSVQGQTAGASCWIDGIQSSASTSNNLSPSSDWRTGSTTDSVLAIGRHITEAQDQWVGSLAEIALWNVYLTAAEQATLSRGFSPLFVRPSALVFYAPLIGRNSPETDLRGGLTGTVTGATTGAHPRIIYPYGDPTGVKLPTKEEIKKYDR